MGQRIKHPVLGEVEQIQTRELPQLSTVAIEIIEVGVMMSLLFFILYKFGAKAMQEPSRKTVTQAKPSIKPTKPREAVIAFANNKS